MLAYDQVATIYDSHILVSPFLANEQSRASRLVHRHVPAARGQMKALDIGCGTGQYTLMLLEKGYFVTALDVSREMLSITRKRASSFTDSLEPLAQDADNLAALDGQFDVIVSFGSVLNHLEDWDGFFANVNRLLRTGGIFLFSFDNVFGIDYLLMTVYSRLFGWNYKPSWHDLRDSFDTLLNGKISKNEWPIYYNKGTNVVRLHLNYRSLSEVRTLLRKQHLRLLHLEGVNLLSCLIPQVTKSEVHCPDSVPKGILGKLIWAFQCLDSCLGRMPHRFAGIHLLASTKYPAEL